MEELEKMSLVELRLYGRKLGMKNATTFKKKELIGEIQKILASGEAPEAEKTAKSSAKGSREKKSDTTEGKRTAKTTAKPAGRRTERRPARKNDYEDSGAAGSRAPRPVVRGGYTSNLQEMHTVREDRRYGSGRDNRYNRDERSNGREDRYSRDERNNGREDRYSRDENGNNQENYSTHDRNAAHDDSQHTGHVNMRGDAATMPFSELAQLDSGETKTGILEVMPEGYGFVRCDNYLPGEADVYVSPAMIRRFGLRTGDILVGNTRIKNQNEKFSALLYVNTVNGFSLEETAARAKFENLTPIFPNERIRLEVPGAGNSNISMRMMDLISPIGKGQRGMIVSQPKTGKTTLLKQVAKSVTHNHPNMHLIVLLIDERPEEVTDIKESIQGENVEVIYSTFDELPENHKRVSEMVIERAKRLVEHGGDVMILLDSITRLARAYNLTVQPSGRTLSGGLDPAALYMPKRFFGAARNMREGGSLTVLATALVDTGSKMDDVVFEEFKGTGNMEMVLDRSLSEKRLFPAIDLPRSSTRRDDLLLDQEELEANFLIRKAFGGSKSEEAVENIISMFRKTKDNKELIQLVKKVKIV